MSIKDLLVVIFAFFPASRIKNWILKKLGWTIGSKTKISSIIAVRLSHVCIGANVSIQPFSVYRDLRLEIGDYSVLGKWNWISAAPPLKKLPEYKGSFKIGAHCGINSRNYFDVSGGISFGDFSDLAGVRSTFITHQIDLARNSQTCAPIQIGNHVIICSNTIFVPGGTKIGDNTVVAMGSVVTRGNYEPNCLLAGNPVKFKKYVSGAWFERISGPSL